MSRLIDADRLMEAVEEIDWYHLNNNGEMVHGANDDLHQPWYKSDDIYKAIKDAPTVEVPTWIPCSERLPESDEYAIVTILDERGDAPYRYADFGWYLDKANCWIVASEQRTDIIAWMPLPRAFKEKV